MSKVILVVVLIIIAAFVIAMGIMGTNNRDRYYK